MNITRGLKIKSNLSYITDLIINDSDSQLINKVVFYPKKDNKSYKTKQVYYLLIDGNISTNWFDSLRFKNVNCMSYFYSDNEYSTLLTKARSEMLSAKLDHNITFNLLTDNVVIIPFDNLQLGDFIEFVTEKRTYETIVTQLAFKNAFYQVAVTLGEFRMKLTEKIKILCKNVSSNIGNISITTTPVNNLDGGEY